MKKYLLAIMAMVLTLNAPLELGADQAKEEYKGQTEYRQKLPKKSEGSISRDFAKTLTRYGKTCPMVYPGLAASAVAEALPLGNPAIAAKNFFYSWSTGDDSRSKKQAELLETASSLRAWNNDDEADMILAREYTSFDLKLSRVFGAIPDLVYAILGADSSLTIGERSLITFSNTVAMNRERVQFCTPIEAKLRDQLAELLNRNPRLKSALKAVSRVRPSREQLWLKSQVAVRLNDQTTADAGIPTPQPTSTTSVAGSSAPTPQVTSTGATL